MTISNVGFSPWPSAKKRDHGLLIARGQTFFFEQRSTCAEYASHPQGWTMKLWGRGSSKVKPGVYEYVVASYDSSKDKYICLEAPDLTGDMAIYSSQKTIVHSLACFPKSRLTTYDFKYGYPPNWDLDANLNPIGREVKPKVEDVAAGSSSGMGLLPTPTRSNQAAGHSLVSPRREARMAPISKIQPVTQPCAVATASYSGTYPPAPADMPLTPTAAAPPAVPQLAGPPTYHTQIDAAAQSHTTTVPSGDASPEIATARHAQFAPQDQPNITNTPQSYASLDPNSSRHSYTAPPSYAGTPAASFAAAANAPPLSYAPQYPATTSHITSTMRPTFNFLEPENAFQHTPPLSYSVPSIAESNFFTEHSYFARSNAATPIPYPNHSSFAQPANHNSAFAPSCYPYVTGMHSPYTSSATQHGNAHITHSAFSPPRDVDNTFSPSVPSWSPIRHGHAYADGWSNIAPHATNNYAGQNTQMGPLPTYQPRWNSDVSATTSHLTEWMTTPVAESSVLSPPTSQGVKERTLSSNDASHTLGSNNSRSEDIKAYLAVAAPLQLIKQRPPRVTDMFEAARQINVQREQFGISLEKRKSYNQARLIDSTMLTLEMEDRIFHVRVIPRYSDFAMHRKRSKGIFFPRGMIFIRSQEAATVRYSTSLRTGFPVKQYEGHRGQYDLESDMGDFEYVIASWEPREEKYLCYEAGEVTALVYLDQKMIEDCFDADGNEKTSVDAMTFEGHYPEQPLVDTEFRKTGYSNTENQKVVAAVGNLKEMTKYKKLELDKHHNA